MGGDYRGTRKNVLGGIFFSFRALTPWPGALPLDPAGGSAPRPPV